jgi:hypothetical protein
MLDPNLPLDRQDIDNIDDSDEVQIDYDLINKDYD